MKNKSTVFCVMRHDFSGADVVVAVCERAEKADELLGEYEQLFIDKSISKDESYFYLTGSVFYS